MTIKNMYVCLHMLHINIFMQQHMKPTNLLLPEALARRLKIYAIQQGKSASAVATEAIEDYLAFREPPEPTPPVVSSLDGKKKRWAA